MNKLELKVKGLYLSPNDYSSVPSGALLEASNCVLDKDSVLESRRGQTFHSDAAFDETPESLFGYNDKLIAYAGDKLSHDDGDGSFSDYAGTYDPPDTDYKIRGIEANRNFYFLTSDGTKKLDSLAGTIQDAGAPTGLDISGSLTGTVGFLADDSNVAYRILWGYRDANNNLVIGAPSQRFIISNTLGGATRNVLLSFTIPRGITTSWFYQIYRSDTFTPVTIPPNDELYLAYEGNPTSAEITAGIASATDATLDTLLGATLYTSPSQQGIENANSPPPFARDVVLFNNMTIYANTQNKQRLLLTLIGSGGLGIRFVSETGDTTDLSAQIDNIGDTSELREGMHVVGTNIPATAKILTVDSATQVTMTVDATGTATGTSIEFQDVFSVAGTDYYAASAESIADREFLVSTGGTPAENIADTSLSIVRVINRYTGNTDVYAYYLSGFDDLPGKLGFEEQEQGGAAFAANSSAGDSFNPVLPLTGDDVASSNDARQNGLSISKANQPESVPLYSYFFVGSANKPIRRILALRDSVFIFKDDGIFRLTGNSFATISIALFDGSKKLWAYNSPVVFDNQIFCFVDQGVAAVSEQGVQIISKPIESDLLLYSQYDNFKDLTFGVGYDSDRKYYLWTVNASTNTYATVCYVWNSVTMAWTTSDLARTCGLVLSGVNKLYTGNPTNNYIYVERKTLTRFDYADESYDVTISSSSDYVVTLADASDAEVGYALTQDAFVAVITAIDGDDVTVDENLPWEAAAATVDKPFLVRATFCPSDMENPHLVKHVSECSYFFKEALWSSITALWSSNNESEEYVELDAPLSSSSSYGDEVYGTGIYGGIGVSSGRMTIRTYLPLNISRANWVISSLELEKPFTNLSLMGMAYLYNPMSTKLVSE